MRLDRNTWALLVLNGLLAGALAWLWLGGEPELQWAQPDAPPPAPIRSASVPPLTDLSPGVREVAWQHPLFSPDRQADVSKADPDAEQLSGVRLTGVAVDGQTRWALLRLASQRNLKLKQGDALDSGWVLHQVDAGSATFQRQGQAYTLNLPVPRLPAPGAASLMNLPHVTAP